MTSPHESTSRPGEIVLAITPRIIRGPGFTDRDLASICIGTEVAVELCKGETGLDLAALDRSH